MATFGGVAAETDCCGNLYPLHVPLGSRRVTGRDASLVATAVVLATRMVWTLALMCAGLL
jgi:hypothetical protein